MPAVLNAAGHAPAARALRFLTAGSIDDGKSTLIGRLLYDSRVGGALIVVDPTSNRTSGALLVEGVSA